MWKNAALFGFGGARRVARAFPSLAWRSLPPLLLPTSDKETTFSILHDFSSIPSSFWRTFFKDLFLLFCFVWYILAWWCSFPPLSTSDKEITFFNVLFLISFYFGLFFKLFFQFFFLRFKNINTALHDPLLLQWPISDKDIAHFLLYADFFFFGELSFFLF